MKKNLLKNKVDLIGIVAQAFYGNRTYTEIDAANLDGFIQGNLDSRLPLSCEIDRTMVRVPGTDNLVIIYNKFMEEKSLEEREKLLKEDGYEIKPLAEIPEEGIKIYSRCIVCRIDEEGNPATLEEEDGIKFMKYLAV